MKKRTLKDWFYREGGWLTRHLALFDRSDWPDISVSEPLYRAWFLAFERAAVAEDVADRASFRLAEAPPKWKEEHLPELLRIAGAIRAAEARPTTIEAARAESLDCPDCGGAGLARRYLPEPSLRSGVRGVSCLCTCPAGRFLESYHRASDPGFRARMIDLADRPDLRLGPVPWCDAPDNRHRYHPASWDESAGRPRPVDPAAYVRHRAARGSVAPRIEPAPTPTRAPIAGDPILVAEASRRAAPAVAPEPDDWTANP